MAVPATRHPCLRHSTPVLLLLLPALSAALRCANLRTQQSTFNWDSLQLLHAMAPSPPQPCAQHDPPFPFPDTLLAIQSPQQATAAILRVLQHLFTTLSNENTPAHWDSQAHQQLLNQLHDQIQLLQQCLPRADADVKSQGPRNAWLTINRYFRRIQDFLRTNHHSPCAWDKVGLEARACFQCIDKLTRRMESRSAPSLQTHPRPKSILNESQKPPSHRRHLQQRQGFISTTEPSSSHGSMQPGKRA
ncbi:interferon-like [Struthio camelus]|uniref:interferon n=1 Tax=Struthio camelus TaxID=8801 RepID=UPI003603BEE0